MKLSTVLLISCVLQVSASAYSQNTEFSFSVKNKPVSYVLKEIEDNSDFRFFYQNEQIDVERLVSLDVKDKTAEEILQLVFDNQNVTYQIRDNNLIVLQPGKSKNDNPVMTKAEVQLSVTGAVKDKDGQPLPGVSVIIKGSTFGVITDSQGAYSIKVSSPDAILVFSFIGMRTQEIKVEQKSTIDVVMEEYAIGMNEVVVTALGIKKERKALGYSVQEIKTDELNKSGDSQVTSALLGKVAGLSVVESGSGIGGSSSITIRGNSSLSGNNEPLWVVDGIPFSDEGSGGGDQWGGIDRSGKILDLNPEDIESISVLKGANAAALYGSRAGNGVILITTKKGTKNQKGLGIKYDYDLSVSVPTYFMNIQKKYGQGDYNTYDASAPSAWGPEFDGRMVTAFNGKQRAYSSNGNLLKSFLQTGVSQTHNLSVEGGTEKGSFSSSIGTSNVDGLYKDLSVDKKNASLAASYEVNKHINVDGKLSYFYNEIKNQRGTGDYSIPTFFYQMPSNISLADLAPGYTYEDGKHVEYNYTAINSGYRNPYFIMNQIENNLARHRLFGYLSLNVSFTDNLKLRIKHGTDMYRETTYEKTKYADATNSDTPCMNMTESFNEEDNTEALLMFNKDFRDFSFNSNLGANRMYKKNEYYYETSGKIDSEDAVYLSAGTSTTGDYNFSEKEIHSVYGSGEIGYKKYAYFSFTGRNDWSSTLPAKNRSYFYPSFSLSGIVTDALKQNGINIDENIISFAKIRASWAQVGKDTDPYSFTRAYTLFNGPNGLVYAQPNTTMKLNSNLKPEIATSREIGTDIRFFNNRVGLDFTYYNSVTKNQILSLETSQASGYTSQEVNAGKITNKGIELMINTVPVKINSLTVTADFNFAKNVTNVDQLSDALKESIFAQMYDIDVLAIEGQKFGQIRGTAYRRDSNGNKVVDADGIPLYDDSKIIGNIQPDWTGSVNLGVDYNGFFVSALVNFKKGGDIVSLTEMIGAQAGTAKCTEDRSDRVVKGVVADANGVATTTANTTAVNAESYWKALYNINEAFVYDASYIKLQNLVIGYNVPHTFLSKISKGNIMNARLSFVGKNLCYFLKHTPGTTPDGSALTNSMGSNAWDYSPVPGARSYGFNIRLEF